MFDIVETTLSIIHTLEFKQQQQHQPRPKTKYTKFFAESTPQISATHLPLASTINLVESLHTPNRFESFNLVFLFLVLLSIVYYHGYLPKSSTTGSSNDKLKLSARRYLDETVKFAT